MFKRGAEYTRKQIGHIVRPDNPPKGGNWDTGYATLGSDLFVFMNIGVPGRTGHDFENHYDEKTKTIVWFSKPNKHSSNPLFQKILSGELTIYFFARWDHNPPFTFLGTGNVISFEDGYKSPQGYECIKTIVSISEISEIITPKVKQATTNENKRTEQSSFLYEKHLEDYLITNWNKTPLSEDYDIYEENGKVCGRQFKTDIGPIDILGQKKDKTDFLVVELKRDIASDKVVGQTARYMGWVEEHLCKNGQSVNGCIIANKEDTKLYYALKPFNKISFMKYEIDFKLNF